MKIFRWYCVISFLFFNSLLAVTSLNDHESVSALSLVSIPIEAVSSTDTFTTGIFSMIDATFGTAGIGMDASQVEHLKKTYLYLIFLTKLSQVQKNPAYQQYQTDFATFLIDNKTSLPNVPTATLLASEGWANVVITAQDLQNSTAWQLYVKTMIVDIYVYFSTVLGVIHNVEKQMFNYVPHFETSFYNHDYTTFRTLNEMARTRLVIEESLKKRWHAQCTAWATLPTLQEASATATASTTTLETEVVAFRSSIFYKTVRDMHTALGVDPGQGQIISNSELLAAPALASPLKEHVWCYYMLYEASGQITSFMTMQNLAQVLQTCSSSSSSLVPNIFPYMPEDYVLLDELISLNSKVDGSSANSANPSPANYKVDEIIKPEQLSASYQKYLAGVKAGLSAEDDGEVQAQMWGFLSDIGHDFSKAYSDVKSGVESGYDAVKDVVIAAGQGVAGLGATAVGFFAQLGGDASISKWAGSELQSEQEHFDQAATELSNSMNDFADSLKDGIVAPLSEVTGDLVTTITADQELGQSISSVIASVSDTLVQLAADYYTTTFTISAELRQNAFQAVEIGEQLAVVLGDAAWAIFSDKGREVFLQQGQDLGKECVDAVAQAFSTYFGLAKSGFSAVLTGMGVIINAITTIFIDLSQAITYLFTGGIFNALRLSDIPGFTAAQVAGAYATEQANHVSAVLNAHRSTINMVLGIVGCVAADAVVDIATGGAGTAADAEIDLAIIGASESASEVAADATVEATEATADVTDATTALDTAEESLSAAKTALENAKSLANLPEGATDADVQAAEDAYTQAEAQVTDARSVLADAKTTAEEATARAKQLQEAAEGFGKYAKDAGERLAKNTEEFSKSLGQKLSKYAKSQIQSIKNLSESIPKAFANLSKTPSQILDDANAALDSLPADATPAEQAAAKQAVTDAQKIVNETKLGKFVRYGKNLLKTIGTVLKPVGMVMNVTFNMGSIIGAANQDAKNALDLETQAQALQNLWKFENEYKISTAQMELDLLQEMKLKAQAQVGNQALSMTVTQNFINANILGLRQSLAELFAPEYVALLTPDPTTNLLQADIGTSWKVQTNCLDMYPSQGFFTTTTGRQDFPFAQEIAQSPDITISVVTKTKGTDKLWFNQRCTSRDNTTTTGAAKNPTDPLLVQINMQFLYSLNSGFHVGLYLGGNYHDYSAPGYVQNYLINTTLAAVQSTLASGNLVAQDNVNPAIVDLDEAHLAKMVVLYRDSATSTIMFGVYEHEGLGWILQTPLATNAQLDAEHSYTLQANLNNTQLQVQLFVDGATEAAINQTVTVTQLQNQRTYGIVCSGAAIEWNQITPAPEIETTARTTAPTMISEVVREQNAKLILQAATAPTFGSFKLTPLSKQAILQGQYLYATTNTDLQKILPTNPADFVVFGLLQSDQWQLGLNPNDVLKDVANARLVSMVNGTVYDVSGHCVGSMANAWTQYQASTAGPFPEKLATFITEQQSAVTAALTNVKFGQSWLLDIVSPTALENGQYLYTCMQTLRDSTGAAIIDSKTNQPMIDYVVCADYSPEKLIIGIPPTSQNANALFSFVTGNVYAKNAVVTNTTVVEPLSIAYQGQQLYGPFGTYAAKYNMITDPLFVTTIPAVQISYGSYLTSLSQSVAKPSTKPITILPRTGTVRMHFGSKNGPLTASKYGYLPHAPGIKVTFGKHDLGDRQKEAAGSSGYQFYGRKKGTKLSFSKK